VTPAERAQLRKLADAATPGPWRPGQYDDHKGEWHDSTWFDVRHITADDRTVIVGQSDAADNLPTKVADAAFIASARTAVPALLDAVERLEKVCCQRDLLIAWATSSVGIRFQSREASLSAMVDEIMKLRAKGGS
jgi:hypothetical protein